MMQGSLLHQSKSLHHVMTLERVYDHISYTNTPYIILNDYE